MNEPWSSVEKTQVRICPPLLSVLPQAARVLQVFKPRENRLSLAIDGAPVHVFVHVQVEGGDDGGGGERGAAGDAHITNPARTTLPSLRHVNV